MYISIDGEVYIFRNEANGTISEQELRPTCMKAECAVVAVGKVLFTTLKEMYKKSHFFVGD